ncbi:MAG: hypothetical protein IJR82_01160 [Bacilli bacterium]|nr:hypothetical protein [Bacilli bacterium]
MNVSPKCAVELLEIIQYLDDDLKKYIDQDFESYLNRIKDNSYNFKINKKINLFENDFMDETIDVLEMIFCDNY